MTRTLAILGAASLVACPADPEPGETTSATGSSGTTGGTTAVAPTEGSATTSGTTAETPTTTVEPVTTGGMSSTGEPADCEPVAPTPTIVPTTAGAIEGTSLPGGGVAFRGVRYAEPPVGPLRFRPPEPRACTPGVTTAHAFGSVCPQVEKDAQGQVTATKGEEDCLTLNVWTPGADAGKRPVLVYIHGGGNSLGSGSDELFDGAALAAGHDVVVVTLNYRLGVLGWLTNPVLAAESADGVSGNYGLLDQVLALRWVQDNIAGFGGDPQRVLLFGESAGAVNTCSLIGSPRAAGLFQRAIVQSGACGERALGKYETDIVTAWTTASGCKDVADAAQCLRDLSVDTILAVQPDGYPNVAALGQAWGPHVDGAVLPKPTLQAMSDGTANDGPTIFGANAQETAQSVPPLTVAQYEGLVKSTFGPFADQVLAQYPAADYGDDGDQAYVALTSDVKFICSARKSARAAATGLQGPVFRYHFAYDAYDALQNTPKAAFHGLELVYIFGTWNAVLPGNLEYQPNAQDLAMSARMQAAWVRFAATGDPAGMDLAWPVYEVAKDNAALLDEPPGLIEGVRTQQCDFWDGLIP